MGLWLRVFGHAWVSGFGFQFWVWGVGFLVSNFVFLSLASAVLVWVFGPRFWVGVACFGFLSRFRVWSLGSSMA